MQTVALFVSIDTRLLPDDQFRIVLAEAEMVLTVDDQDK
jgi:hypothetical protein